MLSFIKIVRIFFMKMEKPSIFFILSSRKVPFILKLKTKYKKYFR